MTPRSRRSMLALCISTTLACSGGDSGRKLDIGREPDDDNGGSAGFNSGAGQVGDGGIGSGNLALSVRVQDIGEMTIEVITLACAGDCADVEAVAHGGNPPYALEWEDGSKEAKRHVCLDESAQLAVSATDTGIESEEFAYKARTARAEVTATVLDCPTDGGVDADVPLPSCDDGEAVRANVMGEITYFGDGAAHPAGRYRITHLDGCMKFGPPVGWTIHNFGVGSWYVVGETSADQLGVVPGITGLGLRTFDECVTESRRISPLEIDFAGGKLGIWLFDMPYTDNVEGEDGRNPTWCLTRL